MEPLLLVVLVTSIVLVARKLTSGASSATHQTRARKKVRRDELPLDDWTVNETSSPNKRFTVGWRRGHQHGTAWEFGRVILRDSKGIVFSVTLESPNAAYVDDAGNVVVEDWLRDDLSGAIHRFNSNGEMLWTNRYSANIGESGISRSGKLVFVTTLSSDSETHSQKVFLLDGDTGKPLWVHDGWEDVRFKGEKLVRIFELPDGSKKTFAFDANGNLPDELTEAQAAAFKERDRGRHWVALPAAQEALRSGNLAGAESELALLKDQLSELPPKVQALYWRTCGEISLVRGDKEGTLRDWEKALLLDPKVGIRRRLDQLRSQTTGD